MSACRLLAVIFSICAKKRSCATVHWRAQQDKHDKKNTNTKGKSCWRIRCVFFGDWKKKQRHRLISDNRICHSPFWACQWTTVACTLKAMKSSPPASLMVYLKTLVLTLNMKLNCLHQSCLQIWWYKMAANCEQDPWSMHMYSNMIYEKNCSTKGKAQFFYCTAILHVW